MSDELLMALVLIFAGVVGLFGWAPGLLVCGSIILFWCIARGLDGTC